TPRIEPSSSDSPTDPGVAVPPPPAVPVDGSSAAVAPPPKVGPRLPPAGEGPSANETRPTPGPRPTTSTPTPRPTAKALFFAPSGGGETVAQPGLQYRILRVSGDGPDEEVDPQTVFRTGDRIRLSLQSNIDGHLYIVQRGASGSWTLLFPSA